MRVLLLSLLIAINAHAGQSSNNQPFNEVWQYNDYILYADKREENKKKFKSLTPKEREKVRRAQKKYKEMSPQERERKRKEYEEFKKRKQKTGQ